MLNDLRYARRMLARAPVFSAVVVLTLALGIGANTAVFSVVHAVLIRPLPYWRPGELVALYESLSARREQPANPKAAIAPATTRDWQSASSFSSIAAYADAEFILTGAGDPDRIRGANVAWTFFDTLGVRPLAGRFLVLEDDGPDRPLVAVIGHDLWRARFGGNPAVVGQGIELSGRRHTIVGVAPQGFDFPAPAQVWTPLSLPEAEFAEDQRLSLYLHAVARLRPEVSPGMAAADLRAIAARLAAEYPEMYEGRGATVIPLLDSLVVNVRPALLLLLGTVGCVLLIACVNVANLMLARVTAREAELTTRAALGASRARLVRQLLTESLVLASAGAVGGVLLALWARDAIVALAPAMVPRIGQVSISSPVVAFAGLLTLAAGAGFGLAPALLVSRRGLRHVASGGRKGTLGPARSRAHGAMVVAQLAISLALLTGAGLLVRTIWKLSAVDPGFDPSGVMTMELVLPRPGYAAAETRMAFFDRVLEILRGHPRVIAAGGATNLPLSNTQMTFGFHREGMVPGRDTPLSAGVRGVTPGYFRALSIPLVRGRDLGARDRPDSAPVVLINDAMRRKFWANQDPLGRRISITRGRAIVWREIVGIVGDIRHAGLGVEPEPEIYLPYAHDPFMFLRIAVRSDGSPVALAAAMRAAVRAVDPGQPVSRLRAMDDVVAESIAPQRFNATMIGAFAVLSLALAAVGLYGVIAYTVTLRLHEFGVRLALGADRRHVLGLVLRQGLWLSAIGLGSGFALALPLTRTIESQLYATTRTDPATFGAVAGILACITLFASLVPARRALNVDPVRVLRADQH